MQSLFIKPKPCKVMTLLRDGETSWYLTKLAKSSDTTYVYVTNLIGILHKLGFVSVEKKGKNKLVKLTDHGLKIANTIDDLVREAETSKGYPQITEEKKQPA